MSRCGLAVRRQAGKQKDLGSIPLRLFLLSTNVVVCGRSLVTLLLTIYDTLNGPLIAAQLANAGVIHLGGDKCSDTHTHTRTHARTHTHTHTHAHTHTHTHTHLCLPSRPFPLTSSRPSLISFMVSVDVQHHERRQKKTFPVSWSCARKPQGVKRTRSVTSEVFFSRLR